MKNLKRAYRRHKKHVKFLKRVKIWFAAPDTFGDKAEFLELTMQGKHLTFLKTTGKPCSCICCVPYRYKRQSQYEVIREALKE